MKTCKDTEILKRLKGKIDEGQFMDAQLRELEEKHVLEHNVDKTIQIKAKCIISNFTDVIKEFSKIKLSALLFALPLTKLPLTKCSLCARHIYTYI